MLLCLNSYILLNIVITFSSDSFYNVVIRPSDIVDTFHPNLSTPNVLQLRSADSVSSHNTVPI